MATAKELLRNKGIPILERDLQSCLLYYGENAPETIKARDDLRKVQERLAEYDREDAE